MEDKILSSVQVKAIKSISKYGETNYKSFGIKPNTIQSLVKIGVLQVINDPYVRRIV